MAGLDMSLEATGISLPDRCVTVETKGANADTLPVRRVRLMSIHRRVVEVIGLVDLVVIEGPAPSRATGHVWDRAGVWWRVVDELLAAYIPVAEVSPSTRAKYATGKGNAGKDAVLLAAARRYPDVQMTNNNEADATVLRAMGLDWLGEPIAAVPKTHRAALDAVRWPTIPGREAQ